MPLELKGKLQPGEKEIARFIKSDGEKYIFERQDKTQFAIQGNSRLEMAIDLADEVDPILEIICSDKGKYTINELDAWPKEK